MNELKKAKQLNIQNCYIIEPISIDKYFDTRGSFIEIYNKNFYDNLFQNNCLKEINISTSRQYVFRGLHCDDSTNKLIQCISGAIKIYLFDILTNQKYSTEISEYNSKQIFIAPKIFLGYECLTEHCKLLYCLSENYKGSENQYTMSAENIFNLKYSNLILSQRDQNAKRFEINDNIEKFK